MKRYFTITDTNNKQIKINHDFVSSIEVEKVIDKIDCDEEGIQDLECFEITIIMSNGKEYIDNCHYAELYEVEYI